MHQGLFIVTDSPSDTSLVYAVSQCKGEVGFPKNRLFISFSQPISVKDALQVEEDEGEKLLNVIEPPPEGNDSVKSRKGMKTKSDVKRKRKVVKKIIRRTKEGGVEETVQETVLSEDDLVREHSETIVNTAVHEAKKTFSRESLNE